MLLNKCVYFDRPTVRERLGFEGLSLAVASWQARRVHGQSSDLSERRKGRLSCGFVTDRTAVGLSACGIFMDSVNSSDAICCLLPLRKRQHQSVLRQMWLTNVTANNRQLSQRLLQLWDSACAECHEVKTAGPAQCAVQCAMLGYGSHALAEVITQL